jgi:hypothetical protein
MIIECNYCESQIDGKILAQHREEDCDAFQYRVSLIECPVCKMALVGQEELYQTGPDKWEWTKAVRVWPNPKKRLDYSIPSKVRASLEEANLCFKAQAYNACVVMCGKVLECICLEHKTKERVLRGGLKQLLDRGIIDKKLFEWSEALRLHRNIGAHAGEFQLSKEDSKDLLDFANAICEYIFVLRKKFEDFMQRSKKKNGKK